MRVFVWIAGILSYLLDLVVVLTIPVLALALLAVTWPFDRNRVVVGRVVRWIPIAFSRSFPFWRIRIEGRWPPGRGAHVVVANHQSFLDVFALCNLPGEMKWIAKRELFRIPMFGWAMSLAGDISLDRGDGPSALRAVEKARRYLRGGMNVMVFPEGTRSPDGKLLPFKAGAFKLAVETGTPVLPIAVSGTASGMPRGSLWLVPTRITIRILDPVAPAGTSNRDLRALRDEARARIARALGQPDQVKAPRAEPAAVPVRASGACDVTAQAAGSQTTR